MATPKMSLRNYASAALPMAFNFLAAIAAATFLYSAIAKAEISWALLWAVALFGVFGNLDRLKKLVVGVGGVTAEMQELNDQAERRLEELRQASKVIGRAVHSLSLSAGRMGGVRDLQSQSLDDLFDGLRKIGLSEEDMNEIRDVEYPFVCFDYVSFITKGMAAPGDKAEEWNEFWSADIRKGIGYEPSPDELGQFLQRFGLMSDRTAELVEDYRFYKANRRHRDPTRWDRRAEWRQMR